MVLTSRLNPASPSTCPVNLITGLLGSGKTTFIQSLLQHKPHNEVWGLLINDFGEIGIDAATLSLASQHTQNPSSQTEIPIIEVTGGCLCCSAFNGYQQALTQLLNQKIDRLLIEPTGLGHPAKIIDLLKQPSFTSQVHLAGQFCVTTPQQLTPQRWQKSVLLRDLITLADTVILNKTDLATDDELAEAQAVLQQCYPPKEKIVLRGFGQTQHSQSNQSTSETPPCLVDFKQIQQPFYLLAGLEEHQTQLSGKPTEFDSRFPYCLSAKAYLGETSAIGWVLEPKVYFSRPALKRWLETLPYLVRAKGLVKTGNEWQHLNSVDQQLQLTDIAWRQDSRLELLFNTQLTASNLEKLETELEAILFTRDK